MPRRLRNLAASVFAAALFAGVSSLAPPALAPAQAQTDADAPQSIVPRAVAQNAAPTGPSGSGVTSAAAADDGVTRPSLDTGENADDTDVEQTPAEPSPLGGLGDEAPVIPIEEAAPPEEENIVGGFGINLVSESREREAPLLHTALQPEPHDLDPYLPLGVRIGSFVFFPELETGVIGSNNVLGTRTDPHADAAYELASTLRVQSDWSRHSLTFLINSDDSWYANFPVEDDRIYSFLMRGRLDVSSRTHFGGELEGSQTQAGRNSVSLTDISGNQINLHEQHAIVSADHTFNRLTLKASQTFADYNYDDFQNQRSTGADGVPVQDVRDYSEAQTILRSTYEFNSAWAGFVEGAVNNREYREPVNVAGFRRGSDGYVLLTGADLRLWGTLLGEISFGWGQQQPIDDRLAPVEGPLINADLIWMMTPITKVEFIARSEIDETTLEDSAGAVDRFYSLSLQHAFWRYLVLGGYGSYEVADFAGVEQVDQRVKGGLTGEYYFNPIVSLYGRYEHTHFVSTSTDSNYDEDEVRMGIKLRR